MILLEVVSGLVIGGLSAYGGYIGYNIIKNDSVRDRYKKIQEMEEKEIKGGQLSKEEELLVRHFQEERRITAIKYLGMVKKGKIPQKNYFTQITNWKAFDFFDFLLDCTTDTKLPTIANLSEEEKELAHLLKVVGTEKKIAKLLKETKQEGKVAEDKNSGKLTKEEGLSILNSIFAELKGTIASKAGSGCCVIYEKDSIVYLEYREHKDNSHCSKCIVMDNGSIQTTGLFKTFRNSRMLLNVICNTVDKLNTELPFRVKCVVFDLNEAKEFTISPSKYEKGSFDIELIGEM